MFVPSISSRMSKAKWPNQDQSSSCQTDLQYSERWHSLDLVIRVLHHAPHSIGHGSSGFQRQHILQAQLINQDRKNVPIFVSKLLSSNSKSGGTANQSQQVEREPWTSQRLLIRPAALRWTEIVPHGGTWVLWFLWDSLVNSDTVQNRESWLYKSVTFMVFS